MSNVCTVQLKVHARHSRSNGTAAATQHNTQRTHGRQHDNSRAASLYQHLSMFKWQQRVSESVDGGEYKGIAGCAAAAQTLTSACS